MEGVRGNGPDGGARRAWAATRFVAEGGPLEAKHLLPHAGTMRDAITEMMTAATLADDGDGHDKALTGVCPLFFLFEV